MRPIAFGCTRFSRIVGTHWRTGWLAMLAMLALGSAPGAIAAEQKFKDWTVACNPLEGKGAGEVCQMSQAVVDKKEGKAALVMIISREPKRKQPVLEIIVPLGVLLPPGLTVRIDGSKASMRVPFMVCANGCSAVGPLSDDVANRFKRGQTLQISFRGGQRAEITREVFLSGFTAAYAAISQKR